MNAEKRVEEIMTKNVIVVEPTTGLAELERILKANKIHHLMVVDNGTLTGVISKNDLLEFYRTKSAGAKDPQAQELMVANPMTVEPDDTIGLVADVILANKFHSLPVVDDGELLGIVTNHDLIKYAFQ